jgi:DNA primase large subunit
VFVAGGMAFVPGGSLAAIIVSRFRMFLSKQLLAAKASFPAVSADPRLAPLLHGVHKQYVGATDFSAASKAKGALTPEALDDVAKQNMPLCMAKLHATVRRDAAHPRVELQHRRRRGEEGGGEHPTQQNKT